MIAKCNGQIEQEHYAVLRYNRQTGQEHQVVNTATNTTYLPVQDVSWGTITTQTIMKFKLRMMTQNARSLTDKMRHSTPESFLSQHPSLRGQPPTADLLL